MLVITTFTQGLQVIGLLGTALWHCQHRACQHEEGCYHCPDCHQDVVTRWVQYRCSACNRIRPALRLFGKGVLCEPRCLECGGTTTQLHVMSRPHYFSIQRGAFLMTQLLHPRYNTTFLTLPVFPDLARVWIWIQPSPSG